jgi:hypothetical protein
MFLSRWLSGGLLQTAAVGINSFSNRSSLYGRQNRRQTIEQMPSEATAAWARTGGFLRTE